MNKIIRQNLAFLPILLFLVVLIGSGCSFTDFEKQEKLKNTMDEKGLTTLLSPEQYRLIIDEEVAKLAREKLNSTTTKNRVVVEEVEVAIQEIKNNCNLDLPDSVVLSPKIEQKLNKGYVCRYVKGSTATRGRLDNFVIKFFGDNPFEFGVDDQINFPTSFGYLKLKDITGNSLIERRAEILTLVGEVYLESSGPAVVSTVSEEKSSITGEGFSPVVGIKDIKETDANSKIYLILPNDGGKRGDIAGCGDSLIDIGVNVKFTSADKASKIKIVLDKLFSMGTREYSSEPLIINPLYKSNISIESVKVFEKKVYIGLVGNLDLEGICDTPRFEDQIKATVRQFGWVKTIEIVVNPLSEKDFF